MIIDCFLLFNEFDLLECRLEYLDDVVDYFIIVEADHTFSGIPKDFGYIKNFQRYIKYNHKIIYFPIHIDKKKFGFNKTYTLSELSDFNIGPQWKVEWFSREKFDQVLKLFAPNDIIIFTDIDEIPNKEVVIEAEERLKEGMGIIGLSQILFYYNFNQRAKKLWMAPYIANNYCIKENSTMKLRSLVQNSNICRMTNGGWHLSFWSNPQNIKSKLEAYSHQENNQEKFKDEKYIIECINSGKYLFNKQEEIFLPFDINTLPLDFYNIFQRSLNN